jgi:hypothetical protein
VYICGQLHAPLALNFEKRKAHRMQWIGGRVDLRGGLDSVERRKEGFLAPAGSRTYKRYYLVIFFFSLVLHFCVLQSCIQLEVPGSRIIPVAVQKSVHRRKGGGRLYENMIVLVFLCSTWHLMKNNGRILYKKNGKNYSLSDKIKQIKDTEVGQIKGKKCTKRVVKTNAKVVFQSTYINTLQLRLETMCRKIVPQ